ncbi:MAG: hypothetical protein LBI34_00405 [Puniceicoccales bacterium]|jgi:hypothetical protein|nr:hypothetical protein [Puniceicoccales bacterium]
MNGVGIGNANDFMSVNFATLTAGEAGGEKGISEKSTMPTVGETMRETATTSPYEPNSDEAEILGSMIPNGTYVPIFPPLDMVAFDDTDNETVEATRSDFQPVPMEGSFGESAAVAPQDLAASAEARPNSGGTDGISIDIEGFVEGSPESMADASERAIGSIEQHLAQEDISDNMRSALELTRDGFERAMEALQGAVGNDFGANERAIDAMEKALEAAMESGEIATDSHELDLANEIHELAGNLKNYTSEGSSKAILGVMMSIFALLNLRDGPELRGPTWQGGLAHAVLDPSTPAYAKKKATRILNMAQRYKEIMKQQGARMGNGEEKPQPFKKAEKSSASENKTSLTAKSQEGQVTDRHGVVRGSANSHDSERNSDGNA